MISVLLLLACGGGVELEQPNPPPEWPIEPAGGASDKGAESDTDTEGAAPTDEAVPDEAAPGEPAEEVPPGEAAPDEASDDRASDEDAEGEEPPE